MTDIPKKILARKDSSPEEFKAQQDRIAAYVQEQLTKDIEKHANEGGK
jgi:hypothetical protein